jgi:hypothetical protein
MRLWDCTLHPLSDINQSRRMWLEQHNARTHVWWRYKCIQNFSPVNYFVLICIVEGGVQTGFTRHVGHWMAYCTCPSATLSTTNPTWPDPGLNPGCRGGKPATNRLSYGTASFSPVIWKEPATVATQSKAWTVFARSNAGIVGSNPTQGMDVCVRLFCVCVAL